MTLTPGDDLLETARQRTRDQYAHLKEVHGDAIIVDSDDEAEFGFICSSTDVLIEPEDVPAVQAYFDRRTGDDDVFSGSGAPLPADQQPRRTGMFVRYALPTRRRVDPSEKSLLLTLHELDRDLGPGVATPNHLVHICPKGSLCPATEPTETDLVHPELWPPLETAVLGTGVRVVVIDTGFYHPTADELDNGELAPAPDWPWPWLAGVSGQKEPQPIYLSPPPAEDLRKYAGHGTFVAGVIRAVARGCEVHVLRLHVDAQSAGGGVLESEIVDQLDDALSLHHPHLINLSAGFPTRHHRPSRALEDWWNAVSNDGDDFVLVAAAGNNGTPDPFWPASFPWAVGVGSRDHDGRVSSFSNYGDSVDVFALGRNVVNAFPQGTYVCDETPDRFDVRVFNNWRARWSGTSFAAPLVTGLLAVEISRQPAGSQSAQRARDAFLAAQPRIPPTNVRLVPAVPIP